MAKRSEHIVNNYDPVYYQNNEFGKVGFPFDVIKANKETYAEVFSEGSQALKQLLLHLWNNDIETFACCVGHQNVPSYTKDTLFGPKVIDRDEYYAHAHSRRYHFYLLEQRPYFVFKIPVEHDTLRVLKCEIKEYLSLECPQMPFHMSFGDGRIGIYLNHCVPKLEVERFFSAVSRAVSQVLGLQQVKEEETNLSFSVDNVGELIDKATAASVRNQRFDKNLSSFQDKRISDFNFCLEERL